MPQFPSPRFLFWTHFAVVCGDLGTLHCFAMLISTKGHLLRDKYLWKNVRRKYTVAEKLKKTQKTYKTRNIARTALVYQIPFVGHRNHRTSKSQKKRLFFFMKNQYLSDVHIIWNFIPPRQRCGVMTEGCQWPWNFWRFFWTCDILKNLFSPTHIFRLHLTLENHRQTQNLLQEWNFTKTCTNEFRIEETRIWKFNKQRSRKELNTQHN